MLVLTRRVGESFGVADNITITLVEIRGDKVRIGIEAPREIPVIRDNAIARAPKPPACHYKITLPVGSPWAFATFDCEYTIERRSDGSPAVSLTDARCIDVDNRQPDAAERQQLEEWVWHEYHNTPLFSRRLESQIVTHHREVVT